MSFLTQEDLRILTEPQGGWCVSIYMPTVNKSQEVRQNPIRFKKLLDQVAEKLHRAGHTNPEVQEALSQARVLLDDGTLWQRQEQGLAVFFAPGIFQTYPLPFTVDELAVVNDHFHIKPILPLIHGGHEFYILALSKDHVHMYRADERSVEEVEVPGMPETMDETIPDKDNEKKTQWLPPSSQPRGLGIGGGQGQIFHGHGQGSDKNNVDSQRFFRRINEAVFDYLKESHAPLVLAGVDYLLPLYRHANTYTGLVDEIIEGNPERVRAEELRDEAWKLIKPRFEKDRSDFAEKYRMLSGSKNPRAVKDIQEVVKAAPYGRVEVLFVDKNAKRWGTFDEQNVDVKFENEQRPGNQDLLDYAAVQTLMNGGTVYVVEPQDVPEGGSPVAAILRY